LPIVISKYHLENITSNSLGVKQNAFLDTKKGLMMISPLP